MYDQLFIFQPGRWEGEGLLRMPNACLEASLEVPFLVFWEVFEFDSESYLYEATQEIRMDAHSESIINHFVFSEIEEGRFDVEMVSEAWGTIEGTGFVDSQFIGWEFQGTNVGIEGFECYQMKGNAIHSFKGEYGAGTEMRTQIEGTITKRLGARRKKSTPAS
ncbi:MAG: hypothetical protein S4CHLAM102_12420 [Chlamydiia bacterium]|nr:hypothetical protein [Chlamydiia bacterium]